MGMGRSGRSFAVEGSRRSCQFFEKKRDSTFGLFWLWEETGYVWDVVAGSRRGKPVKSRVADFSKKKGLYFWAFLAVRRNGLCMGCSCGRGPEEVNQ